MNIDAVDERAGDPVSITEDLFCRATTAATDIAGVAAGTGIHRGNQLEFCRESAGALEARDDDGARFHRLAQSLESVAGKLGKFIEEQHAKVGER